MEETKKKSRFVGIPFSNYIENLASKVEEEMNKLEDEGYAVQIIQFPTRSDVLLFGRLLPPNPFEELMKRLEKPVGTDNGKPAYVFKHARTQAIIQECTEVLLKNHSPGATFAGVVERVTTCTSAEMKGPECLEIAEDLDAYAENAEPRHKPGCCDHIRVVHALSAAFRERARIRTS
jgi:hypothetical protein